jgi:hypothetical protein
MKIINASFTILTKKLDVILSENEVRCILILWIMKEI